MKKLLLISTLLQTLLFASFDGTIIDKNTLKPIANAQISDSTKTITSDINGTFSIKSLQTLKHMTQREADALQKCVSLSSYNAKDDSHFILLGYF